MLTTVCLLVGPVYWAVYPGDGVFCEKRNTITMILLVLYFIMMWPFQYCIYLFYKQVAKVNEPADLHTPTQSNEDSPLQTPKNDRRGQKEVV